MLAVFTVRGTLALINSTESQGGNQLSGATFSPTTAPVPVATRQTSTVSLSWSAVTLTGGSHTGTMEYTTTRSDSTTICSLTATTSCTDSSGNAGTNYTYTEETFYVVGSVSTWSLGPSGASNQVNFPGNRLAFTTGALSGAASSTPNLGAITVQRQDTNGNALTTGGALVVNLASSPSAGATFGTSQFGTTVSSVTIASGQSTATFWYGESTTGSGQITASATGFGSATQTETLTTAPAGLGLTNESQTKGTFSCTAISQTYSCTASGVGNGGTLTANVDFVTSSGVAVVYSSTDISTITLTSTGGHGTGVVPTSLTVAANATTSGSTFTASTNGSNGAVVQITFGPYTLTVNVNT